LATVFGRPTLAWVAARIMPALPQQLSGRQPQKPIRAANPFRDLPKLVTAADLIRVTMSVQGQKAEIRRHSG
jgi:hypothetical protein